MSKTFCIKPWRSSYLEITGNIKMCCWANPPEDFETKNLTLEQWWDSDYIRSRRKMFLTGQEPPECKVCFDSEKMGVLSDRQKANAEFKILPNKEEQALKYYKYPDQRGPEEIELTISNYCNLKCLTCVGELSSSIATENAALKVITQIPTKVLFVEQTKQWLSSNPKRLAIQGGEPLISPGIKEIFAFAKDNGVLSNLELMVTTNATKIPDMWLDYLPQFKSVQIVASLESTGTQNNYIRYGSKWDVVSENIKKLAKVPNVNLLVHASPSSLSILVIDKLITWCSQNDYQLDINPVVDPEIFNVAVMPKELLTLAKNRVEAVAPLGNPASKIICDIIDDAITNNLYDTHWDKFKAEINMRDNYRKVSILEVMPEFRKYW